MNMSLPQQNSFQRQGEEMSTTPTATSPRSLLSSSPPSQSLGGNLDTVGCTDLMSRRGCCYSTNVGNNTVLLQHGSACNNASSAPTSRPPSQSTMAPDYSIRSIPPPEPYEIELVIPQFMNKYLRAPPFVVAARRGSFGNDMENAVYSEWRELPSIKFRLMVHPLSQNQPGLGTRDRCLGAFVEVKAHSDYPEDWILSSGCKFHIYVINASDYRNSHFKSDSFPFSYEEGDRGWHQLITHRELIEDNYFVMPNGDLHMRATCLPVAAAISRNFRLPCPPAPLPVEDSSADRWRVDSSSESPIEEGLGRNGRGYVGLRNHGATCYMNALLQSLYFIGRFRQAVYALSFDTRETSGHRSVDILERRRRRRKRWRTNSVCPRGSSGAKRGEGYVGAGTGASFEISDSTEDDAGCNGGGTCRVNEGFMDVESRQGGLADVQAETNLEGSVTDGGGGGGYGECPSPCSASRSTKDCTSDVELPDGSRSSDEELLDLDEQELRDLLMDEAERRSPPSISLALQNLFFKLYTSCESVPCKELIRSFGWDAADACTQQDTHELLKLLLDKVEEQMRGTPAEGSVKSMFEGEMETYIECINVPYKSSRKEIFEDINLDVQGITGVKASLKRLVSPELLDGDNMYDAEQHGKQPAKKGIRFIRFPPVCVFLLKRFDFDYARMDTVKVFDRFEFERELDLSEFCESAGMYELHSVSVHQGDVNSGHYYCFLRPPPGTQWVRFDDDKVYHVSEYAAIGDNFGGEELDSYDYLRGDRHARPRQKPYNAYILVYVRKNEASRLLADCSPLKVNPQVLSRCLTEEQLRRLRARIRRSLEQSVKVKVYHPLQFKYRRFMELPYASISPLFEIKTKRDAHLLPIHNAISEELVRLLYRGAVRGGGNTGNTLSTGGSPAQVPSFALHVMNTSMDSVRFEGLELNKDIYVGEVLRGRTGGSGGGGLNSGIDCRFDAALHILAVPEKPGSFRNPATYDECIRQRTLLFIKFFENFGKSKQDKLQLEIGCWGSKKLPKGLDSAKGDERDEHVICLDVVSVPAESKLRDLEPHVYRLLLQAMDDKVIGLYRYEDIKAYVSSLPSSLPALSSTAPYPAPLPSPLQSAAAGGCDSSNTNNNTYPGLNWHYGVSVAPAAVAMSPSPQQLSLSCCLEMDKNDKVECCRLAIRKSLSQNKIYSGDLLVWSLDLPKSLQDFHFAQQDIGGRPEDVLPQEECVLFNSAEEGHSQLELLYAKSLNENKGGEGLFLNTSTPNSVQNPSSNSFPNSQLLPFISRQKGGCIPFSPPPLPLYISSDFLDYYCERQYKVVYQVRLYDAYELMNRPTSSCGRLLEFLNKSNVGGGGTSLLHSELSGVNIASVDNPGLSGVVTTDGTLSAPLTPHTDTISTGATAGTVKVADGEEDESEDSDIWMHVPRSRPILVLNFELDGRLPAKQVFLYIAWHMGVDPTYLHIYPEPPLLTDRKQEPLHIDSFVTSVDNRGDRIFSVSGSRQMSLDEVYMFLEKQASWPGRMDRRRCLATVPVLPRVLHMNLLHRHYKLCSRIFDSHQLSAMQKQQLQKELLMPLPAAAFSSTGVSSAGGSHILFNYVVLVFNGHVESVACINSILAAVSPTDNRPHTALDLVYDVLQRLPRSISQQFEMQKGEWDSLQVKIGSVETSRPQLVPFSLSICSSDKLEKIDVNEPLQQLPLYQKIGPRQRECIQNLLAVPLRLEPSWSTEENDLILQGSVKILTVVHQTPGERERFGYPFELLVKPDATLSVIKIQVKDKLLLLKNGWGNCSFFQMADGIRTWKGPNDVLDWNKHKNITLIAEHLAPYTNSKNRVNAAMRIA